MQLTSFTFECDGRAYACGVEPAHASREGNWWWFTVTGDRQRYAPFEACASDTHTSVRTRVLTYYVNRLARLAEPYTPRFRRPPPPASQSDAAPAAG